MKVLTLALSLLSAPILVSALAFAEDSQSPTDPNTPPEPVFQGSCVFEGQYASGCIEFYDGTWTEETTQQYCQAQSKAGAEIAVTKDACVKADYNAVCAAKTEDGSIAQIYVNNMPSIICKKYMNGVLTKRPATGWPS